MVIATGTHKKKRLKHQNSDVSSSFFICPTDHPKIICHSNFFGAEKNPFSFAFVSFVQWLFSSSDRKPFISASVPLCSLHFLVWFVCKLCHLTHNETNSRAFEPEPDPVCMLASARTTPFLLSVTICILNRLLMCDGEARMNEKKNANTKAIWITQENETYKYIFFRSGQFISNHRSFPHTCFFVRVFFSILLSQAFSNQTPKRMCSKTTAKKAEPFLCLRHTLKNSQNLPFWCSLPLFFHLFGLIVFFHSTENCIVACRSLTAASSSSEWALAFMPI